MLENTPLKNRQEFITYTTIIVNHLSQKNFLSYGSFTRVIRQFCPYHRNSICTNLNPSRPLIRGTQFFETHKHYQHEKASLYTIVYTNIKNICVCDIKPESPHFFWGVYARVCKYLRKHPGVRLKVREYLRVTF